MFPAGRPELRTRYLDLASGLRVRAVESGDSSAPLVLFVPGWGCSAYVFRENFAPLAEAGYHTVSVDLKGHGLSDKPVTPGEYRLEPMRLHVAEILDALGAPAIICGLSMGAMLGCQVAASSPGRVRGLVMVSPVGYWGVPGLTAIRLATGSVITPLLPRITGRWVVELLLALVNGKLRRITKRDVEEYWAPTQFPEFTLAMRQLLHEFTWDAPFIPPGVPSLLISGTRDLFVSRAGLSMLRRIMPGTRHVEVENAGHVVCDEAAAIVNQELLDFFEKLI
jgi:4,5:9,10-diseco-3-hydroxy-5,9,17-trioxoandrosta-1(10),2-diene-4-oate hydrolase